jgi:hypothetical protein
MYGGLWVKLLKLPCSIKMFVFLWPTEFKTNCVLCVCKYSNFLRSAWNDGLAIITSLDRQTKSLNLRRSTTHAQLWNTTAVFVASEGNFCKVGENISITPVDVSPCHHGMARPQVADGGTASYMEGSCE